MQFQWFQALETPKSESLEVVGFLLFFQFEDVYLYLLDLGKLIAKVLWIKISRSTEMSLWGSHLIADIHGSVTHVRLVQKHFHFYNYPEIVSSSPFSAPDRANIPFAVNQAEATKTCSKGLHIQA